MRAVTNELTDTRDFLSQSKFYESYSRFKEDESKYETWDEAVDRVVNMHKIIMVIQNNLGPILKRLG